jgi:hypothetical protein
MIVGGLFGRVGNVKYVEVDVDGVAEPVDMMRFELSQSPVDSHVVDLPSDGKSLGTDRQLGGRVVEVSNGHFDVQNPALATLAFCGGKPSDLEAAEGSMLTLAFDDHGHLMPANVVVTQGRKVLEEAAWSPDSSVETEDG